MGRICGKVFGAPIFTIDNREVLFPYGKVKALFCYMVVNKIATRDELAALLWEDEEEGIAKKNLRNAIYKIKQCFDMEILVSPKKSMVSLNDNIEIELDLHIFEKDSEESIEAYTGEFLQGFYIKNAEIFESWTIKTRQRLKDEYIRKLYRFIENAEASGSKHNVEKYCKIIIDIDEFDEKAYRILMNYYRKNKNYSKAIDLYNKLSKLLDNELGITPDFETKKTFNDIIDSVNKKENDFNNIKEFFYGRVKEIKELRDNYNNFLQGLDSRSIVLMGEAGIGKTRLKDEFIKSIDTKDIYLIEANCYQVEKEYFLKPWYSIFNSLSNVIENNKIEVSFLWENVMTRVFPEFTTNNIGDNIKLLENANSLKYEVISDVILEVLKKVSKYKKILFLFEDIQWMDKASLCLLNSSIIHGDKDFIFLATCRNEYDEVLDNFLTELGNYNKIKKIEIKRFNYEETQDFIEISLPQYNMPYKMIKKIYEETEGNTFFLVEYLNNIKSNGDSNIMSTRVQDILKSRFLYISEEGKKLLNIVSLFFDEAPMNILIELTGKDEIELMDTIEELENKFILKEVYVNDEICFRFTHQKLREYVYMQQSYGRKKILHNKIGKILEESLSNNKRDISLYHKLIYHYSLSNNKVCELKYIIKNLDAYLSFTHELFPVLTSSDEQFKSFSYYDNNEIPNLLKNIEDLLRIVKEKEEASQEIIRLEILFLHMKGRFLIRQGQYEEGILFIEKMINYAESINDSDYALKGYRQMIYYCIQTNNADLMIKYISLALDLAEKCGYKKEIGILLRLKGRYKIMRGKYEEGEELLNKSIEIFSSTKEVYEKYSLNIAAAYNYIGDIRKNKMKFLEALKYYDKAIKICEEKSALNSLSIFNINAGQAAFYLENYLKAERYFNNAFEVYNKVDSIWGLAIAEAFMALLQIEHNNYDIALNYLKNAECHAKQLKNPHEIGIVYIAKAEIKVNMKNNEELNKVFIEYLDQNEKEYCEKGIEFLKIAGEGYEVDKLYGLMQ